MTPSPPLAPRGPVLLTGSQHPLAGAVQQRLQADGHAVLALAAGDDAALAAALADGSRRDALVLVTPTTLSGLAFDAIDDAAFEAALEAQLLVVVRSVQAALPWLAPGAQIVIVGSRGHLGAWGGVHQMAASAGLVAMARSMALELQPDGLGVNLVASEFSGGRHDTPQQRAAVAHAVAMLCARGHGITGQCLVIDDLAALRMSESRRPGPDRASPS